MVISPRWCNCRGAERNGRLWLHSRKIYKGSKPNCIARIWIDSPPTNQCCCRKRISSRQRVILITVSMGRDGEQVHHFGIGRSRGRGNCIPHLSSWLRFFFFYFIHVVTILIQTQYCSKNSVPASRKAYQIRYQIQTDVGINRLPCLFNCNLDFFRINILNFFLCHFYVDSHPQIIVQWKLKWLGNRQDFQLFLVVFSTLSLQDFFLAYYDFCWEILLNFDEKEKSFEMYV